MSVLVKLVDNNILALRVQECNNFIELRNKLMSISGKEAEYSEDGEFKYWKFPLGSFQVVLKKFQPSELDIDPKVYEAVACQKLKDSIVSDVAIFQSLDGKALFPHQEEYVKIDPKRKALLCSFEMGAGKSRATLVRAKTVGFKKLLVIVPSIVVPNWITEIREIYGVEALAYSGDLNPTKRYKLRQSIKDYSVFVVNYEMVGELSEFLPDIDHVIIDEIHNLSNPKTKIYKDSQKVVRKNKCIIQGASGTPIRLRVRDLWGVLNLLDPVFAGSRSVFLDTYEVELAHKTIIKNGHKIKIPIKLGTKNEDHLKERLDCILYRAKRDTITTFKEKIEIVSCPLVGKQAELYNDIKEGIIRDLETKELYGNNNTLVRMLRLLQVSEGCFNLYPDIEDSGKYEIVKQELTSNTDKIIVWSRFKPITEKILQDFSDRAVIYNGDTSPALKKLGVWAFQGVTNEKDLEEFNRLKKYHPDFKFGPGEASIFTGTVNLRSGLGINLHKANKCIFTSFDFNPQANMQAKDRISRIGQTAEIVNTQFLVSEGTIEYRALSMILTHYENSLKILDGKRDNSYLLIKDLIDLLKE